MKRPDCVAIGGFTCPTKYISYFDKDKVATYLAKRFPYRWGLFPQTKKINKAKKMIARMGVLQCRPLLLGYIEDLLESPYIQDNPGDYVVYQSFIESWLRREEKKIKIPWEKLKQACELLALEMQKGHSGKGVQRHVSEAKLNIVMEEMCDISYIKQIDIKGKSLLNRNADGEFRFSHFSIQEFLVAHHFVNGSNFEEVSNLIGSESVFRFLSQKKEGKQYLIHFDLANNDLSPFNLNKVNLRGKNLSKTILKNIDFRQSDLNGANLSGASLSRADLSGANLTGSDLRGADLSLANLKDSKIDDNTIIDKKWRLVIDIFEGGARGKDFKNVDLSGANLSEADLSGTDLTGSDLRGADLTEVDLTGADLTGADLTGANLSLANLKDSKIDDNTIIDKKWRLVIDIFEGGARGKDFKNVDLSGANLNGADFSGANLTGSDLRGADLAGANLNLANLKDSRIDDNTIIDKKWRLVADIFASGARGKDFQNVNLSGANLSGANLTGSDLRGADLTGANLNLANLKNSRIDDNTIIDKKWRLVADIFSSGA